MGTGTPIPGTTSAVDSPAAVAAAGMLMEGQFGNGNGGVFGNGSGVGMGLGLTPRMGTGFTPVAMQLTASQGELVLFLVRRIRRRRGRGGLRLLSVCSLPNGGL